jgi:hypothetical protein
VIRLAEKKRLSFNHSAKRRVGQTRPFQIS